MYIQVWKSSKVKSSFSKNNHWVEFKQKMRTATYWPWTKLSKKITHLTQIIVTAAREIDITDQHCQSILWLPLLHKGLSNPFLWILSLTNCMVLCCSACSYDTFFKERDMCCLNDVNVGLCYIESVFAMSHMSRAAQCNIIV